VRHLLAFIDDRLDGSDQVLLENRTGNAGRCTHHVLPYQAATVSIDVDHMQQIGIQ
jgi:hypothetical protein